MPPRDQPDAFNDAISTEVKADPKTGVLPTFTETVAGKKSTSTRSSTLST